MAKYILFTILVILLIATVVKFYYTDVKGKTKDQILHSIKEEVYKLFLYAQKQGWAGPEKMDWCVDQILKLFPDQINKWIEEPIREFMQGIYDEFQKTIYIDNAEKLGIKVEMASKPISK